MMEEAEKREIFLLQMWTGSLNLGRLGPMGEAEIEDAVGGEGNFVLPRCQHHRNHDLALEAHRMGWPGLHVCKSDTRPRITPPLFVTLMVGE